MPLPALNASAAWVAIILAAGHGTRLEAGIEASAELQHLLGIPKGLLPCGEVPLLDHWLYKFRTEAAHLVGNVMVVTNEPFKGQYRQWARKRGIPGENVLGDGTYTHEARLGAVRDLEYLVRERSQVLQKKKILILDSDIMFYEDFSLASFLENTASRGNASCVFYNVSDQEVPKRGIIEVDKNMRVKNYLEKPSPRATSSRKACPIFYAVNANLQELLHRFLNEMDKKGADRDATDAPGTFWGWLVTQAGITVSTQGVTGRFDVAHVEGYERARNYFKDKVNASVTAQLLHKDTSDALVALELKLLLILTSIAVGAFTLRAFA